MMNRYKMFFIMVMSSLLRRRTRMAIALLAVAIGATIISGMITVYKEVPEQMGRAFRAYGANLLILPAIRGRFARMQFPQFARLSRTMKSSASRLSSTIRFSSTIRQ